MKEEVEEKSKACSDIDTRVKALESEKYGTVLFQFIAYFYGHGEYVVVHCDK